MSTPTKAIPPLVGVDTYQSSISFGRCWHLGLTLDVNTYQSEYHLGRCWHLGLTLDVNTYLKENAECPTLQSLSPGPDPLGEKNAGGSRWGPFALCINNSQFWHISCVNERLHFVLFFLQFFLCSFICFFQLCAQSNFEISASEKEHLMIWIYCWQISKYFILKEKQIKVSIYLGGNWVGNKHP